MAINFTPNVGQVLECNFGEYTRSPVTGEPDKHPNHHIPPEMVKNRLVVVLNGKVSGSSCIVVPLSTSHDLQKTHKGWHVQVPADELPELDYFGSCLRWAKADMVAQISRERLNRPRVKRGREPIQLSHVRVGLIQRAVIKAISAASLLAAT